MWSGRVGKWMDRDQIRFAQPCRTERGAVVKVLYCVLYVPPPLGVEEKTDGKSGEKGDLERERTEED